MAVRVKNMQVHLEVKYVPCPPEHVEACHAGLLLLTQLFDKARKVNDDDTERLNHNHSLGGNGIALFPVENANREGFTKTRGIHAWVIGNHGSVQLMAYGSRSS